MSAPHSFSCLGSSPRGPRKLPYSSAVCFQGRKDPWRALAQGGLVTEVRTRRPKDRAHMLKVTLQFRGRTQGICLQTQPISSYGMFSEDAPIRLFVLSKRPGSVLGKALSFSEHQFRIKIEVIKPTSRYPWKTFLSVINSTHSSE